MSRKVLLPGATDRTPVMSFCIQCRLEKQHEVLKSIRQKIDDDMESEITDYQIVICLGCKSLSFRMQLVDTDLYFFDKEQQQTVISCTIKSYPEPIELTRRLG